MAATRLDTGRYRIGSLLVACSLYSWLIGAPLIQGVLAIDRLLYWNVSNPIFKPSGANIYLVPKNDRLMIVCPTNGLEFYRLFWTHNADAAAACQSSNSQVFLLLQCANPSDSGAFQVSDFSPIPGAPTFERTVYIFTPSTGGRLGIQQTQGGACETRNMRLNVDMGNPDLLTQPATQVSTTAKAETIKSVATTATATAGEASSTGTTSGGANSGASGSTQAANNGKDNRMSPTAQDLSRRAQTNIIVGAETTQPSVTLIVSTALCLHLVGLI